MCDFSKKVKWVEYAFPIAPAADQECLAEVKMMGAWSQGKNKAKRGGVLTEANCIKSLMLRRSNYLVAALSIIYISSTFRRTPMSFAIRKIG
jgi:hypothetical protein